MVFAGQEICALQFVQWYIQIYLIQNKDDYDTKGEFYEYKYILGNPDACCTIYSCKKGTNNNMIAYHIPVK